jgi:threonine dehydrogenase-like Zn-dependent dehydrogenase
VNDRARFVVQTAPETYELRDVELPDIGPDEGLIAVEACGICGTDVEVFNGQSSAVLPLVPGHEAVGRILRIGERARLKWEVAEGDRVAVHSTLTCGRCRTCRAGLRGCTAPEFADSTIYGFRSPDVPPSLWGGFSTHLFLAPEAMIVPMSDDISVGAASLYNVMANGVDWVLELGAARPGQSVAVLGPGPRGLACAVAAQSTGAGPVIVTGLEADADRLAFALELGADHAIDVTGRSAVGAVMDTLGRQPDIVIDTTPMSLSSVTDAVNMAARRGVIVLAGLKGPNATAPIPIDTVSAKQLTIKGAVSRSLASMEFAIQLIDSKRWDFDRFASHGFALENAAEAVRSLSTHERPLHARIDLAL